MDTTLFVGFRRLSLIVRAELHRPLVPLHLLVQMHQAYVYVRCCMSRSRRRR